jgi:hypothetical protein
MLITTQTLNNLIFNHRAYNPEKKKAHEIIVISSPKKAAVCDHRLCSLLLKNLVMLGLTDEDYQKAKLFLRNVVQSAILALLTSPRDRLEEIGCTVDEIQFMVCDMPWWLSRSILSGESMRPTTKFNLSIPNFEKYKTEILSPTQIAENIISLMGLP